MRIRKFYDAPLPPVDPEFQKPRNHGRGMLANYKLTLEQEKQLLRDYQAGCTKASLALKYKISPSLVNTIILRRAGTQVNTSTSVLVY